jgi:hypothetical protein
MGADVGSRARASRRPYPSEANALGAARSQSMTFVSCSCRILSAGRVSISWTQIRSTSWSERSRCCSSRECTAKHPPSPARTGNDFDDAAAVPEVTGRVTVTRWMSETLRAATNMPTWWKWGALQHDLSTQSPPQRWASGASRSHVLAPGPNGQASDHLCTPVMRLHVRNAEWPAEQRTPGARLCG